MTYKTEIEKFQGNWLLRSFYQYLFGLKTQRKVFFYCNTLFYRTEERCEEIWVTAINNTSQTSFNYNMGNPCRWLVRNMTQYSCSLHHWPACLRLKKRLTSAVRTRKRIKSRSLDLQRHGLDISHSSFSSLVSVLVSAEKPSKHSFLLAASPVNVVGWRATDICCPCSIPHLQHNQDVTIAISLPVSRYIAIRLITN